MSRKNTPKAPPRFDDTGNTGKGILFRTKFHFLLILVVGILIYSNSFHSPFLFDEPYFIVRNPVVKNLDYFIHPSLAEGLDSNYRFSLRMRYIGYLTFAINHKIHGFDVFGYHLVNLLIHVLNGFWVYLLILRTIQTPFLKDSFLRKNSNLIALFSSLLFVSHPLQTEAVTYVFQRQASLVAFFYLLSLLLYVQGRLLSVGQKSASGRVTLLFVASLISTVLAMKTKENAITLPLVITIYEFFFFNGKIKTRVLRLIPWFLTMAIIPVALMQIHGPVRWMMHRVLAPSEMVFKEVPREAYLFTQFRVVGTYIRLLFLPIQQNFDYVYPIYRSLFGPQVLLSLLLHLALLSLAVYLYYRSGSATRELRLICFGIFWFYVTLSVESSVIPLPMIICEYRVYLPSVGWVIGITSIVWIVVEKLKARIQRLKQFMVLFLVSVVMVFSVLTYARNTVWGDKIKFWEDVTKKSPSSARGHYNLALVLVEHKRFEEAELEFQSALRLNPLDWEAMRYLGLIYGDQGHLEEAIKSFQSALTLDPNNADLHYNLGVVLQRAHRLEDAVREFQAALRLNPMDASSHNNLGVVYGQQGRLDEAVKEFKAALEIDPNHAKARENLEKIPNR
jgi:tetratricopeptide (TPR) repeat protein